MPGAFWLTPRQYVLVGGLVPGGIAASRGSMVVTILRLRAARRRGVPDLPFEGKCSTIRVCRVELAPVEELAW
jgi:hypothetical protein